MSKSAAEVDPREYCKFRYSAPSECCKCGNCQLVPPARLVAWSDQIEALDSRIEELEKALREIDTLATCTGVVDPALYQRMLNNIYRIARAVLQPKGTV